MRRFSLLCSFYPLCLFLAAVAIPAALSAQTPTFSSIQRISGGLVYHGNFNGNGNTDLIVGVSGSPSLEFLNGDGTGKFFVAGLVSAFPPANATLIADVNGDGKDDIITLLAGCQEKPCSNNPNDEGDADGIFTVMLSQGNGVFTRGYVGTLPPGLDGVEGAVADFNKDGKPDIAVLAFPGGEDGDQALLCIFINQGDGTFTQTDYQTPQDLSAVGPAVTNLVTGDFEGNGNEDVAFAFYSGTGTPIAHPEVLTFAGNGKGGFGPGVVSYTFDSEFPFAGQDQLFAASLNSDSRTDLVISIDGKPAAGTPMRVPSLLANPSGRFYWSSAVSLDASSGYPVIVVSDLNGDGKPDLLFLNPPSGTASPQTAQAGFYLGLGTGAFKTPHIPVTFTGTPFHANIAAIPLKKGGLPSLFVYNNNLPYIQLRINTTKQ